MYALPMSAPEYAGGEVVDAPLNAPPSPLPLCAACLLGIVMKVLQQLHPLYHCRDVDYESGQFVGAGSMSGHLL